MQRIVWRLAAASGVAVSLALGAGTAGASGPGSWQRPEPTAVQKADQSARTHQKAGSSAKSVQFLPINANVPVQILGFGSNGGDTKQSNNSTAESAAWNQAWTGQSVDQHQKVERPDRSKGHDDHKGYDKPKDHGYDKPKHDGYDKPKDHGYDKPKDHGYDKPKDHGYDKPKHDGYDKPKDHGYDKPKDHGYDKPKDHGYDKPKDHGYDKPAYQWADQHASTDQNAWSKAESKQILPLNVNIPFQALSFGHNGGDTKQSNNSTAKSFAGNNAWTGQSADQYQKVDGSKGHGYDDRKGYDDHKGYDQPRGGHSQAPAYQSADQHASTDQNAWSKAESKQVLPINVNAPIQVLGFGHNGGDTKQSNNSTAKSFAGNSAWTGQSADQHQKVDGSKGYGGQSGPAYQGAEQRASTDQDAWSKAESKQIAPINVNAPIQILGFGHNGGDTYQSNNSTAVSGAGNDAWTAQKADQSQSAGSGPAFQGAEQGARTEQDATSSAKSEQFLPVNANVPVQILSFGSNGGDTYQSNNSTAVSGAGNQAGTLQSADQAQGLGGLLG